MTHPNHRHPIIAVEHAATGQHVAAGDGRSWATRAIRKECRRRKRRGRRASWRRARRVGSAGAGGAGPRRSADGVGVGQDDAFAVGDGEVVDEGQVLGEQGVDDDAEGVLEQNDGGELGSVDEVEDGRRRERCGGRLSSSRGGASRRLGGLGVVGRRGLGITRGSDVLAIAGPH